MIVQAGTFWPLKLTVLKYVVHAFMDTADVTFLQPSAGEEDSIVVDEENEEEPGETEV